MSRIAGSIAGAIEHPAALGSFTSWVRLVARSGGVDAAFWPRVAAVGISTLVTSPLRVFERVRYGHQVQRMELQPPLFIIGHWRTGTTHLHNLLCQDPQFGYLSTFQAMAPGFCLVGERWIQPWLARKLARSHPTREIDSMPLLLDGPQEEAFALANLTPCASLHVYALPRRAREIFAKYALLVGLSPREQDEWTRAYLTVLRKAALRCQGKQLVLKDPANTGRLRFLLSLFPAAKFVHIYRNPYRVFPSTLGVFRIVLRRTQLQHIEENEVEALVLEFYEQLMKKFLAERDAVPRGQLVEVRYEDLDADPLGVLRRVYEELALGDFEAVRPRFEKYLVSVRGFRKNTHRLDPAGIEKVNARWGFALDEWDYLRLEPATASAA